MTIISLDVVSKNLIVNVDVDGGILYVYLDGKFLQSITNYHSLDVVNLDVAELYTGNTVSILYFIDGVLVSGTNVELIRETSSHSTILKSIPILDIFSDDDLVYIDELKNNLFNKLKTRGSILHNYLLSKNDENEDFENFWKSIVSYLILFKISTKNIVYGLLGENNDLVSTFLTQRGYILSSDESKEELEDIRSFFYKEITKRGTFYSFKEENLSYLKQGEFLKLIRKDKSDELLINLYEDKDFGFSVGNSSPLYRGLETQGGVLKSDGSDLNELITISSSLDYRLEVQTTGVGNLTIGFEFYDVDDNLIEYSKSSTSGLLENLLLDSLSLERDTFIEGFLFNKDKLENSKLTLNIGVGNSLIFNENHYKVKPIIQVTGSLEIVSYKINLVSTPYSRGLIQVNNFISAYYKNNSTKTFTDVDDITVRFLLPYHVHWRSFQTTLNNSPCDGEQEPNWKETGNFVCEKVLGINTGKVEVEEEDKNICTSSGLRWVGKGIDYHKCPKCLPSGLEVSAGSISCECVASVLISSFGCNCMEVSISSCSIGCNCINEF